MTVEEIARIVGGKAHGDTTREIREIAQLEAATADQLAFAEGARAIDRAADSQAGCVLIPENASLPGRTFIRVPNAKLAFIAAAQTLAPPARPVPGRHPTAVIAEDATIGEGVSVGPLVTVEQGARVGEGTSLRAGVFIGTGAEIGRYCTLHPHVTVYPGARVGDRVVLHSGVVLGADGFGYVFSEGRYHKFPQVGGVIVEDEVEIGANTTIDGGSLGTTRIGYGTKIDNLVQIAHNVRIGRHCVIAAQTGISGSSEIGDYVVIGGQAGIGDHVRIGNKAVIGGQAGVLPGKVIRPGAVVWGTPARPLAEFKKLYSQLSRLPALALKIKKLSRTLEARRSMEKNPE